MKLLHCRECHDVVGLLMGTERRCRCRKSAGLYIDAMRAEYSGPADILLMNSFELMAASPGQIYSWWVAPATAKNIKQVSQPRRMFRLGRS